VEITIIEMTQLMSL